MSKISLIIPSYNRKELLEESLRKIVKGFEKISFQDYQIICVTSGASDIVNKSEKTTIFKLSETQIFPGIARNYGMGKSNSDWIWFVDDDDEIDFEKLHAVLPMLDDNSLDLVAHSLKLNYDLDKKDQLLKSIVTFREKQEVFNFIIKRKFIEDKCIKFSDGIHEDIRYVVELLSHDIELEVLSEKLYNKIKRDDSITSNFTEERITGYVVALREIISIEHKVIHDNKNEIATQCLGTMLFLLNASDKDKKNQLLEHLDKEFTDDLLFLVPKNFTHKSTNFKFAASLYLKKSDYNTFLSDLDYCFRTHISCKDLRNSLFLGPKEIIGCCKRFFYDGKLKGDIVLMPESKEVNLDAILEKKKEIETSINSDTYEPCFGCPYLDRFEGQEKKINYLSLENFTYCNMRCSYCSPKYYGGREAIYDTRDIITELITRNLLGEKVHVVWGGGEPTLQKNFRDITDDLLNMENIYKIRILTNSLRYSDDLQSVVSNSKVRVVTSIDAGTQDTFKMVRGKGDISNVLSNLKRYSENISEPENLTLKYIITDQNYQPNELQSFVEKIKENGFERNFIQISCNFLYDKLNDDLLFSIYELASRLLKNDFKFIYFDDLIRDRLTLDEKQCDKVLSYLKNNDLLHEDILNYKSEQKVILWGDGYQSQWIINNTSYGKSKKIIGVVSNKNGLLSFTDDEDYVIVPAAIQQLTDIYKEIKKDKKIYQKLKFNIFL